MQISLDDLVNHINAAFGEEALLLSNVDKSTQPALNDFLGSDDFSHYLDDHTHREIIRHYLLNAIIQGHFSLSRLSDFKLQLASHEGRAALALAMLMYAVEEANSLPSDKEVDPLHPLNKPNDSHIRLVDPSKPN